MHRFFIPQECIKADTALITGQEAHHILDVMRLKKGDQIQAFDGGGKLYQGEILATKKKQVYVQLSTVWPDLPKGNLNITLVQALPKKNKMDYIVEKCTELGVDSIIPTQTARTIVKLNREEAKLRQGRWQKIARACCKQCGRIVIPELKDLTSWPQVLASLKEFDLKLIFSLGEEAKGLKEVLRAHKQAKRIIFFIGPEGDFTQEEVSAAESVGCTVVSLGKTVLKSDTASLAALAMINYELS